MKIYTYYAYQLIYSWQVLTKACLLLCISSAPLFATAEENFSQGVLLLDSGEYTKALKKFTSARSEGMETSEIYFNIGRTYYKLENYKAAKEYFLAIKNSPNMTSPAEYHLGLIAWKLNNDDEAIRYFKSVISKNRNEKYIQLSKNRLKEIRSLEKAWSVYASALLGYDSNINIAPSDIALNESDSFLDAFISLDHQLAGDRDDGWTAEINYYQINYSETSIYDQDQYQLNIRMSHVVAGWPTHYAIGFDKSTYGNDDYQSVTQLEARTERKVSKNSLLYLDYRYEDIRSEQVLYDYLEGSRQKFKGELRQYYKDVISSIYYELELNNREDLVIGTDEYSYSPTRHTVRGKYTQKLTIDWRLTGDLSYRKSDYPTTVTFNRADDRWIAAIYADYLFENNLQFIARLEYTSNNSSELVYDYDRTLYTIGFNALF